MLIGPHFASIFEVIHQPAPIRIGLDPVVFLIIVEINKICPKKRKHINKMHQRLRTCQQDALSIVIIPIFPYPVRDFFYKSPLIVNPFSRAIPPGPQIQKTFK